MVEATLDLVLARVNESIERQRNIEHKLERMQETTDLTYWMVREHEAGQKRNDETTLSVKEQLKIIRARQDRLINDVEALKNR